VSPGVPTRFRVVDTCSEADLELDAIATHLAASEVASLLAGKLRRRAISPRGEIQFARIRPGYTPGAHWRPGIRWAWGGTGSIEPSEPIAILLEF
jgi:hypothetical protein